MAIARPVTKTIISTTAFGIPVVDSVNALETRPFIIQKAQNVTLSGMAATVADIGVSVAFTAKANRVYRIDWGVPLNSSLPIWVMHQVVGGPIPHQGAYVSFQTASGSPSTYGHYIPGTVFVGPGCEWQFTPGSVTLKLQGTCAGGATWGVSGICRITVSEYGGTF